MNFSAWSIRNPIAPILFFVLLVAVGVQSFRELPVTRFPNIDFPLVSVVVTQNGASPAELERQVTKEVEDAVSGVVGVKNITSTVTDGVSTTAVEFRMEIPTDQAVQDTKDAIDRIRPDLPASVEPPIVSKIDVAGQAIQTFAVSSPAMTLEELSWFVDDTVKRQLQGLKGVGKIERYGGATREIRMELDPAKLDSFGITAADVSRQIVKTNADLGSGRGEIAGAEQAIRTLGDAASAASLSETAIALPNGRFVRLGNLGTVSDTYEEQRSFSRFDGDPVVTFSVFRSKGASEVDVAETVKGALAKLKETHPEVKVGLVDDAVFYTYGNYEAAIDTLIEGALLAVLVVLLFLRNWRATLISAVALPLSAIPTFWAVDMLGFSLNLVSFLAITLATGILVDDAIVEIENIARHIRMGKSPYRAAIDAADEIGLAVIATTFTIIAVFVPVSFMPGIPGQYFRQFGLTVAIAVFFSLLVARLVTPMMAAYLMRAKDAHGEEERDGPLMRLYTGFVRATLRVRYLTLVASFGILALSLFAMMRIPMNLFPPEDVSRIVVSAELPPGTPLAETDVAMEKVRGLIERIDGVSNVFVLGGTSPTGSLDTRRAALTVLLEHQEHSLVKALANGVAAAGDRIGLHLPRMQVEGRTRPQADIEKEVFAAVAAVPDVRIFKLNDRGERDVSFNLLSSSDADLNVAISRLEDAMCADPVFASVASTGALARPELQIRPRATEAARLGVTTQGIADTVRIATIGDVDAALAKLSAGDRLLPVRVQLDLRFRQDLARLRNLRVPTASGGSVPLQAVADVEIAEGPSTIDRFNRERRASVGADLPPGVALDTATSRFGEIAARTELPASVHFVASGDAEIQTEMVGGFVNAMLLGLGLVLTVLILLFKDVIQPFTILFSLPLAIGGVAAALIVTGQPVSMPVMIGFLMLMGIVTKNAILLVDFAVEMRRHGMGRLEAMIEAGRKRARPIVMTSMAMSAGMVPSAMGIGEGGAFRAPMAIAVIGGVIVSTALSLVVVPSFYLVMDDLSRLLRWLFGRFVGRKDEEDERDLAAERLVALETRVRLLEGKGEPKPPYLLRPPSEAAE
ncbi:efflux RND transporter permease subunit [Aureimonas leprariae]|uniref:Efflux RND transporter permease subunit n=1 Tax=Plantimonas leprariae TaxID=2615207 RepID=A0A7V7PNS7_9HYPH|nr:efflux RND transporter permease subunit [Aureimonas leprariae]KAB0679541.1 efflux RND transporter permease subunit [Aureimonas leprariae]